MALTSGKKQTIIFYLGWSGKSIIATSNQYNSGVADRLDNLTSDIEGRISTLIDRLEALDTKLDEASSRLSAKRVDEIELNPEEIAGLKRERKRLCREMSQMLDIPYRMQSNGMVGVCN